MIFKVVLDQHEAIEDARDWILKNIGPSRSSGGFSIWWGSYPEFLFANEKDVVLFLLTFPGRIVRKYE